MALTNCLSSTWLGETRDERGVGEWGLDSRTKMGRCLEGGMLLTGPLENVLVATETEDLTVLRKK